MISSKIAPEVNLHNKWFDSIIDAVTHVLQHDKEVIEYAAISGSKRNLIGSSINEDLLTTAPVAGDAINMPIVHMILVNYGELLLKQKLEAITLAMHYVSQKIYVWAEIKDRDQKTEYDLIGIEAEINAKYFQKTKLFLETTIVEQSDNLEVPPHYKVIKF